MLSELKSIDLSNKVVVTGDIESSLTKTLDLAIALALASKSELHGLFIEDLNLLRAASLPFVQEVILASGRPRVLDNQQVLRSYEVRSRSFRQSLARQAQQSSLVWTYSTVRGNRRSIEMAKSVEAEYYIIGQPPESRSNAVKRIRILLIGSHSPRLYQALEVVLGDYRGQSIELLLATSKKPIARDNLHQLISKLEDHPHSSLVQISSATLESAAELKNQSIDFVIASLCDAELLEEIMQLTTCPMIVVC